MPRFVPSDRDLDFTIRPTPLQGRELHKIDELLQLAYDFESTLDRLERWREAQPDGWLVAEADGRIVGCGGYIAYDHPVSPFAWIGLVATAPDYERCGIGSAITRALVDALRANGVGAVLDASEKGRPLYERMGFVDHGETRTMTISNPDVIRPSRDFGRWVEDLDDVDFGQLVEFDTERFGGDRSRLLRAMMNAGWQGGCAVFDNDELVAYGFAQESRVGPVVADSESALAVVLNELVARTNQEWVDLLLPAESRYLDAVLELGWAERRSLRHFRLGIGNLPGRRELLAGQVSYGEG